MEFKYQKYLLVRPTTGTICCLIIQSLITALRKLLLLPN